MRIPNVRALSMHLWVQRETEARAHRLWLADDRAPNQALNHWLKAEAEVLAECAVRQAAFHPLRPASNGSPTESTAQAKPASQHPRLVACEFIPTFFQCRL